MYVIESYIIGLLIASSLMMAWFYSSLPLHTFELLRRLGYRKNDLKFWKKIPHWETTRTAWEDHISIHISPFWATLLTCKYCLSFHAAFWVAVPIWATTNIPFLFIPIATLSWPIAIVALMNSSK